MLKDPQIYLLEAAFIPTDKIKTHDIRLSIVAISVLLNNEKFSEFDFVIEKLIENFEKISSKQFLISMLRTSFMARKKLSNWKLLVAKCHETGKLSKEELKGLIRDEPE
jgi:hypothetical protein